MPRTFKHSPNVLKQDKVLRWPQLVQMLYWKATRLQLKPWHLEVTIPCCTALWSLGLYLWSILFGGEGSMRLLACPHHSGSIRGSTDLYILRYV